MNRFGEKQERADEGEVAIWLSLGSYSLVFR